MKKENKPEGIELNKKFLEEILKKDSEKTLEGFLVIRNSRIYEGNEHYDYKVIIQKGKDYFQFNYCVTFAGIRIGGFRVRDKNDRGENFFCKRVKPVKRIIINYE